MVSASNDSSNPLAEIKAAYLLHRLTYGERAPSGYDILKLATRGSARLLGRNDIGVLAPGKAADLFALDMRLPELAGADLDPANLPGTVGYSRPAKFVMVNGAVVARDGRLPRIDEPGIYEKSSASMRALLARAGVMS